MTKKSTGTDTKNNTQTFYSLVKQDSVVIQLKASLVDEAKKIITQIKLEEAQKLPLYELLTFCDSRIK